MAGTTRLSRRDFMAMTAGGVVLASAGSAPAGAAAQAPSTAISPDVRRLYEAALPIDTTAISGPEAPVQDALAAGLVASMVDLQIYPRTFAKARASLEAWNTAFATAGSPFVKVLRAADIATAKRTKKFGVVLACQDAQVLDSSTISVNDFNLQNLKLFYGLGLRVLQLTHNERNGVGDAFREKRDAGLSRLGDAVVDRMNELAMLVELSHCSDLTTTEAIARSKTPCIISHAGCRALYDSRRNKTDEQIRALAERGGVFGVFNMTLWMTEKPTASIDTVLDHIDHAVKVAGIEHVAFGSDGPIVKDETPAEARLQGMREYYQRNKGLPGAERMPSHVLAEELNGPDRMLHLAEGLHRRGYAADAIEKVIGGNFVRVFREVCG